MSKKKPSVDEIAEQQAQCRAQLNALFYGPNGEQMTEYIFSVLELEDIRDDIPTNTYYNLGKRDAIETLMKEGNNL